MRRGSNELGRRVTECREFHSKVPNRPQAIPSRFNSRVGYDEARWGFDCDQAAPPSLLGVFVFLVQACDPAAVTHHCQWPFALALASTPSWLPVMTMCASSSEGGTWWLKLIWSRWPRYDAGLESLKRQNDSCGEVEKEGTHKWS